MYINRQIDKELLKWRDETDHKPILLRGARQVGKSSSVRKLAEHFDHFLEINFEKNKKVHALFDSDLIPKQICDNLSIHFRQNIVPGKTLLFFDEIQACPQAISALRFFLRGLSRIARYCRRFAARICVGRTSVIRSRTYQFHVYVSFFHFRIYVGSRRGAVVEASMSIIARKSVAPHFS